MSAPPGWIAELLALPGYRVAPDMHRWFWLREQLDAEPWLASLDAIRVTGSNGKGSTSVMLDAVLRGIGVTTGRITSPHLLRFNERIHVDGEPIGDAEFERALAWARGRSAAYTSRFNAYELVIAAALRHFADRRPELVISEAGKGGRYDPGWVFPSRLAALTSVDLEHTQELGRTRLDIACHKLDICPPHGTLLVGPLDAELLRSLRSYARMREVELVDVRDVARWRIHRYEPAAMLLDLEVDGVALPELWLGLVGEHQAANAALALALAWRWLRSNRPGVGAEELAAAARTSLAELRYPGRFERVHEEPAVYIDVAHTPDGARALADTITAALAERPILVVGLSAAREPEAFLRPLLGVASAVIVTRAGSGDRPHEPARLAEVVASVDAALKIVCTEKVTDAAVLALAERGPVVVTGGHAIAAELAHCLAGGDPSTLQRFAWVR